ncbi:hypothetical protein BS329_38805 [Amycolatopsis coloradensis]|uniref:Uncharacterized protein n=1 Tax=Amycolatopsis coloradensis TaxID=76021 RepID=A0A1R0KER1_9PSEU|nr:hypothetical protein [Amycolatopsis coloradensis]OLZ43610.1 hypothetical protein BS329_38805 [Amycolatopsis coloradensis]
MTTTTIHAASPPRPRISSFRRHVRRLHRLSFAAAQGDQPTQAHFIQAYAREMIVDGVPLDLTVRGALLDHAQRQRLPAGHLEVPDRALVRAEFSFWWHLTLELLGAAYTGQRQALPSRAELDGLMYASGGNPAMSPFSPEEMGPLARTIGFYRRTDLGTDPGDVVEGLLLASIIRVEHGFQGRGERYPARPCTDGGDPHRSRFLRRCQAARDNFRASQADVDDRIYRALCRRLDRLDTGDPVHHAYRALIEDYNRHHPDEPVNRLHVPADTFPADPAPAAA